MINAITTFWFDCTSYSPEDDCHITIDGQFLSDIEDVDIHAWLEDHGWLYLGGDEDGHMAYCPACKKQLYDLDKGDKNAEDQIEKTSNEY